jgi:hypothetical protein
MLALTCCAAASGPSSEPAHGSKPLASPSLPLDEHGIPTRALSDDELFRLLIGMSSVNEGAAMLLARCHSAGAPYRSEGWRTCIMRRP